MDAQTLLGSRRGADREAGRHLSQGWAGTSTWPAVPSGPSVECRDFSWSQQGGIWSGQQGKEADAASVLIGPRRAVPEMGGPRASSCSPLKTVSSLAVALHPCRSIASSNWTHGTFQKERLGQGRGGRDGGLWDHSLCTELASHVVHGTVDLNPAFLDHLWQSRRPEDRVIKFRGL